jgi:hypothetical protein
MPDHATADKVAARLAYVDDPAVAIVEIRPTGTFKMFPW